MAGDQYLWIGSPSGSWDTASNWDDKTIGANPASVAPGANDAVTIAAAAGGAVQVITGTGNSASLTIDGGTALAGQFSTGTLTFTYTSQLEENVVLSAGDTLTVSGDAAVAVEQNQLTPYGLVIDGAGGKLAVGGTLQLGSPPQGMMGGGLAGQLTLTNGGFAQTGALSIAGTVGGVSVDAASTLEVGTAGGAAAGTITVDAGANLSIEGLGSLGLTEISAPTIINHGTITATNAFTIAATSAIDNSGTITLDNTLGVGAFSAPTIVNNGTIVVNDQGANASLPPQTQISGSVTGSGQIQIGSSTALQLGSVGAGGSVDFTGSGSVLELSAASLDASHVFEASIVGFGASDSIDYTGTITSAVYASGGCCQTKVDMSPVRRTSPKPICA